MTHESLQIGYDAEGIGTVPVVNTGRLLFYEQGAVHASGSELQELRLKSLFTKGSRIRCRTRLEVRSR